MPHPTSQYAYRYACMFANGQSVVFLVVGTWAEHVEAKRSELPSSLQYYLDIVYHHSVPVSWFPLDKVHRIEKGKTYYSLDSDEICVAKKAYAC